MPTIAEQLQKELPDEKKERLMMRIKNDYQDGGQYKTSKTDHKNIMLIGRTRTGKSTIKSLLVNPTTVPDDLTLKSGTRDPLFESFHVEEKKITLNIIDTPGLFERGHQHDEIRDNETIMRTIQMCVNLEITKFHVIGFCISLTSGINTEDIESLKQIIKYIGEDLTNNSCLIITHCESKTTEQQTKLVDELKKDAFFQSIGSFFKLGVFFSGSLDRDDVNYGNESVLRQYVTICDYRIKLIELFIGEIEPFPVCEMLMNQIIGNKDNINKTVQETTAKTHTEQDRIIKQLQQTQAQDKAEMEKLLEEYRNAVARETKAKLEANHYEKSYESLLRDIQKDGSKEQRKKK